MVELKNSSSEAAVMVVNQTLDAKVKRETIEKQNSKNSELEEKSQSQDRKITGLEEKFQPLSQYINPTISSIISQLE